MADANPVPPAQPAVPSTPSAPPPAPRRRRRWPWILLALFVLFLIGLALLPTILSTGIARRVVLAQVNKQLNGTVDISSWSLGWFSGVRLDNISVVDSASQPVVSVKSVSVPASVPGLMGSNKKLGAIVIDSPKAYVVMYADGTTNLQRLVKPSVAKTPSVSKPAQPLGFDVNGSIQVRDGEVRVQKQDRLDEPFILGKLDVDVKIPSLRQPTVFSVKSALGISQAPLAVDGSAVLMHNNQIDPSAVEANVTATLDGLDLASVSTLLPVTPSAGKNYRMYLNGRMKVNVKATVQGMDNVTAVGAVDIDSLKASGGPLGWDQPQFGRVQAAFDVAKKGQEVTIQKFSFDSPMASASASGALTMPAADAKGQLPKGSLKSESRFDLAALANQLPKTLKLQQGLKFESGTLATTSTLTSANGTAHVAAGVRIENLAALRGDKRVAIGQPILLDIAAQQTPKGIELENLQLTSSFANAKASGNLDKFNLTFTSDLQAAITEAAKFVDLPGKSAKGRAEATLTVTTPDGVATAETLRRTVAGSLRVTDLELTGFTPKPAVIAEVIGQLDAVAVLDKNYALQQITNVKLTQRSALATLAVTVDSVQPVAGQALPTLTGGRVEMNSDLATITGFVTGIGLMPAGTALAGKLVFASPLAADKDGLHLGPMGGTITGLDVTQGQKHLREPEVKLAGFVDANPATRVAAVRDLGFTLSAGKLDVPRVAVPDWSKAPGGVTADIKAAFDLAKLLTSAADFAALPAGMKVAGNLTMTMAVAAGDAMKADVQATIQSLSITPANSKPIEDPKLTFATVAAYDGKADAVTIDSFKLNSVFATVDARAKLTELSKRKMLDASGTEDLNWDRIGPLANAMVATLATYPVELTGHKQQEFKIQTSLADTSLPAFLTQTLASMGVYIGSAKFMGVQTGLLQVPIDVSKGTATLKVDTTVNDGRLTMPLLVTSVDKDTVVSLPENTAFMAEVKITNDMADQLLAHASPIFKGMVVSGGKISIFSRKLSVPLSDPKNHATFDGDLSFADVTFKSSGFLKTVLDAVGTKETPMLSLPNQKVSLTLRDGRIQQAPIQISAAGYIFRIGGSMGLSADAAIEMTAELPITAEMLGSNKNLYDVLKGQSIRVPITGTAKSPAISRTIVQDNLKPLIEGALKEKGGEMLQQGVEDLFKKKKK